MLVVEVVHRHYSWAGLLLFVSFNWKLAWPLLVPCKLVPRKRAFSSVPVQGSLGPVSKVHGAFSSRDLPSISGG